MGVVDTLPFTLTNGTIADATQVMANYNALVTGFLSTAASGANSDITALLGLTTPLVYTAGGSSVYIGTTSTGSANAQVVASPTPLGYSLTQGKRIIFIAGATNTGATTLNVNSTGATAVRKNTPAGLAALTGGEIVANCTIEVEFDGTFHVLINPVGPQAFGPLTDLASATATDLGTIPSHNVNITGVTTITGFGSSASTTYPIYRVTFAGILTLTHNGTSLIIPGAANIVTAAGDTAVVAYLGSSNWKVLSYSPLARVSPPNIQPFLTGTAATYTTPTTPTKPLYLRVRMLAGGGGGGAGITNAGTTGTATSFSDWTVNPGAGGSRGTLSPATGGAGGTGGTDGTGTLVLRQAGGAGAPAPSVAAASGTLVGGTGGANVLGGAGVGFRDAAGGNAATNSGAGGGGGVDTAAKNAAQGGGAGEYVEFIITSPAATYTYTVGTGGAGGAAGTTAGGNAAAGRIIVEAFFQ